MKSMFLRLIAFGVLSASLVALLAQTALAAETTYWETSSNPPQFCVQNFNAYGPLYATGITARTEGMLGHLKARPKCEIVQLQEVWMQFHINHIEKSLADQYNFADPNRDTRIGIMSLVMGDILSEQTYSFAVNNSGSVLDQARSVANVRKAFHVLRAKLPAINEELYLINTHLHPTSEAVRLTQILDLLKWRLNNQDLKLLLSGDFNAEIPSLERELLMNVLGLRDAMEESFGRKGYPKEFCTYCNANPLRWLSGNHTFDYIFYSNAGKAFTKLKVESGEVNLKGSTNRPLSDHYGIRVQFSVQGLNQAASDIDTLQSQKTLTVLAKALKVLKAQRSKDFKPYVEWTQKLMADLQENRSAVRSYLALSL